MGVNMKNSEDTMLFLEYMKACGFNIEDYSSILEILSNVTLSMSKYLRGYDTYILNSGVNYKDLRSFNLKALMDILKIKKYIFLVQLKMISILIEKISIIMSIL